MKSPRIFAIPNGKGSIAQLVQSICLTSRGSAVRIRVLPLPSLTIVRLFYLSEPQIRPINLISLAPHIPAMLRLSKVVDFVIFFATTSSPICYKLLS